VYETVQREIDLIGLLDIALRAMKVKMTEMLREWKIWIK
jgi:hypothetical protein